MRVDDDDFYVLEDNARTPSGVSYMLENREVMMRMFPDLFAEHRIAPVENYPEELLATLNSVAPRLGARRPDGRAADARPLQQRLLRALLPADKLGIELVEGRDLFVRDNVVSCARPKGRSGST